MYSLPRMTLADMAAASARLRRLGVGAASMEEASQRMARFLHEEFGDSEKGEPGCVLVRVYTTLTFATLPAELQDYVTTLLESRTTHTPDVRCMVLLGSTGSEPAWNSRHTSQQHRAIPLPSVEAVRRLPMVAQLVAQLGVDLGSLVAGTAGLMVDDREHTFNVFHVADARGSPFIPAQDFVERHAVRSVLGFGGQFADGNLYAVIMFSRLEISRDTASAFRPLTLAAKLALMPFAAGRVFSTEVAGNVARLG